MSHIFDALQRAQGEDSGSESSQPAVAIDVLRNEERKVASKWEKVALAATHEATRGSESYESESVSGTLESEPGLVNKVADEALPEQTVAEVFKQFPKLKVSVAAQERLVCYTDTESLAAEAFRLLGVRLRNLKQKRPLKKVLITSTIPQEGKTMTTTNLACTLSASTKQRVLLLDGDLRRPSVAQKFGLGNLGGLSEWLQGKGSRLPNIYHLEEPGLWLLAAGTTTSNALELLQSPRLPVLVDELAKWFDWIFIDSPPVLPLADTSVWMRMADGILLVTRQGTTEKRLLQRGLEAIDQKKLIGALLNCSRNSVHDNYYYHYKPKTSKAGSAKDSQ
jgi:capsular exopolysaccharide synthesis family protein